MHDDIIISYEMDFQNKILSMCTHNEKTGKKGGFIASGVLTYSFEGILEHNIILDINNWGIDFFIKENEEKLQKMKKYSWPICYQNIQELERFLLDNKYMYIKVVSAYGLFGWILTKNFQAT